METRFTLAAAAEGHEPEQSLAVNTYGTARMVPGGRYDAPRPGEDPITLWSHVVAGERDYEPSTFMGVINMLGPARYRAAFSALPNSGGFIERLERLAADQRGPEPDRDSASTGGIYFVPQPHNAVAPDELVELARENVLLKAQIVEEDTSDVSFVYVASNEAVPRGSLHWAIEEGFADRCGFVHGEPWIFGLSEMCYSIAASYDLARWLMQDWIVVEADFEPLYALWKTGGYWDIDENNVCHVAGAT